MAIFVLILIVVGAIYFRNQNASAESWERGIIPSSFRYNADNEMEVIIALAGLIIRKDFRNINEKRKFLNQFFNRYYIDNNYDFSDSLRESYKHPIKVHSAANWFIKHKVTEKRKVNIVQLLINISMEDGELNTPEFETLKYIHTSLKLPIEEFDRLISVHIIEQQRRQEEARSKQSQYSNYSKESKRDHCFKILGIAPTTDQAIIKKAYRALAKEYHPDRFQNDTPIQQKMANEKFIAIQTAYDYLIEN